MTAYLVVLWVYEGLGGTLATEPAAGWWAQRWLWLLAPSAVLAVLVALFARFELAARRPRERQPAESSSLSHGRWTVQAVWKSDPDLLIESTIPFRRFSRAASLFVLSKLLNQ